MGLTFASKNTDSELDNALDGGFGGVCTASPAHARTVHPAISVVIRVLIIRCELPSD